MPDFNFNLINSQIAFEFDANVNIRKKVFEYEEGLKEYFVNPFKTIPVPDTFDPRFPRFEGVSTFGHSRVQVSQVSLNFVTTYDEDFKKNTLEIKKYLLHRVPVLLQLASTEKILFVAIVLELLFEINEELINDIIIANSGANAVKTNTIDFTLLYSFPWNKEFYVNIKCSKYFSEETIDLKTSKINSSTKIHGISVTLDINSKFSFRQGKKFQEKLFNDLSASIFELIEKNSVENFLSGTIL